MPGFTSGGGKPAKAKGSDGAFPTKKGGGRVSVGGAKMLKVSDSDGTAMQDTHMDESMSGSDGPNKGPSFGGKSKFGVSAMSQAIRKRSKSSY